MKVDCQASGSNHIMKFWQILFPMHRNLDAQEMGVNRSLVLEESRKSKGFKNEDVRIYYLNFILFFYLRDNR